MVHLKVKDPGGERIIDFSSRAEADNEMCNQLSCLEGQGFSVSVFEENHAVIEEGDPDREHVFEITED